MRRVTIAFALWGAAATVTPAAQATDQTPDPLLRFEVASVRENASDATRSAYGFSAGGFSATNTPLRRLIAYAYDISNVQQSHVLLGGRENVLVARFDVVAKWVGNHDLADGRLMLRALLADRFGLQIRHERRPIPVFALMPVRPGRLGPQLRRTEADCDAFQAARATTPSLSDPVGADGRPLCLVYPILPDGGWFIRGAGPIAKLITALGGHLERPVVDMTGLTERYEWSLTFARRTMPDSAHPSPVTALSEQLGLRAVPQQSVFDVYVIDHVERPTPD